jgi:CARDB
VPRMSSASEIPLFIWSGIKSTSGWTFAIATILTLFPRISIAGNNAGGSVQLSWASQAQVDNLLGPPGPLFPLFARVADAPDIRSLALTLQWTPNDTVGGCYSMEAGTPSAGCAAAAPAPGPGVFDGDSTYTWDIQVPPGGPLSCVAYGVRSNFCPDTVRASFFILSARAIDSNGALDELAVGTPITIDGGTSEPQPFAVASIANRIARPGAPTVVRVDGSGFTSATRVRLVAASDTLAPKTTVLTSGTRIYATFPVPASGATVWSPIVSDTLLGTFVPSAQTLLVSDTTVFTGNGFNSFDYPVDKITPLGVFRKGPGETDWLPAPTSEAIENNPALLHAVASHAGEALARNSSIAPRFTTSSPCTPAPYVFRDSYESGMSNWDITIEAPATSTYKWGRATASCGPPFSGAYSAHCAAAGPSGGLCDTYVDDMLTHMTSAVAFQLQYYDTYDITSYARVATDHFNGHTQDVLIWLEAFDNGPWHVITAERETNGWQPLHIAITPQFSDSISGKLRFTFASSVPDVVGFGAYVDSVAIQRRPIPSNLAPTGAILVTRRASASSTDTLFTNEVSYTDWAFGNVGVQPIACSITARLLVDGVPVPGSTVTATAGLQPGQSYPVFNTPLPTTLSAGVHTITVQVDPFGDIQETDEFDNSAPVTAVWRDPPNLVITALTVAPNPTFTDTSATVTVVIRNDGPFAAVGPFRTVLHRASTPTLQQGIGSAATGGGHNPRVASDVVDTTFTTQTLAPAQTRTLLYTRFNIAPGLWTYYAIVDEDDVVAEGLNENNRSGNVDLTVTIPPVTVLSIQRLRQSWRWCRSLARTWRSSTRTASAARMFWPRRQQMRAATSGP